MSSIDKDLKRAETLINEGKDFEAIPILNELVEKSSLSLSDQILLSSILIRVGDWEKSAKIAEQAYEKGKNSQNYLQSVNAVLNMACALITIGDLDKASKLLEKSEELYLVLSKDPHSNIEEIEAYKAYVKGSLSYFLGNKEDSLKYLKRSLELREKIGNKHDMAESLLGLSNYYRIIEMDFDKAFNYANQCLKIAEEIRYQRLIASAHFNLGYIYHVKGELEKSLSYYELALQYFEKTNNFFSYLGTMNNMAMTYRAQGKLDKSAELLTKCIKSSEKLKNNWIKSGYNVSMVEVCLDKGDIEKAKEYSERVKQIRDTEKTPYIKRDYKYIQALILKKSLRFKNRAKAEKLLRSLIQDVNAVFEHRIEGLIQLCDLLFDELKITREMEIVAEIKPLINQLLILTKNARSYWYYAETYVLQAKLDLIILDIKSARQLLTKAQNIAEKYGFERLVKKISSEHDDLLKKMDIWEKFKQTNAPIEDRVELANLSDQTLRMIRRTTGTLPDVKAEKPILLAILTHKGSIILSNPFTSDMTISENNFNEFLSSFMSLSKQTFSESFDRVKFGENTVLIKLIDDFYIFYIFQGQTYSAQQKIKHFSEILNKDTQLMELLNNAKNEGIVIQININPRVENLIIDSFMSDPNQFRMPFKAYEGDEPYVFTSYAHADKLEVYPIIDYLNKMGIKIWYDEGIPISENWKKSISVNLERCNTFLVFISPHIINSEMVRKEISFALKKKKPFFAIYLKETKLPTELEFEIADFQAMMKFLMPKTEFFPKLKDVLYHSLYD
ncbi:MAG: tetratricopeptide repeat protein [Promethearchaeota archaeon]